MLAIGYSKDVIVLVIYEKNPQFRLAEKGVKLSCDTKLKFVTRVQLQMGLTQKKINAIYCGGYWP